MELLKDQAPASRASWEDIPSIPHVVTAVTEDRQRELPRSITELPLVLLVS